MCKAKRVVLSAFLTLALCVGAFLCGMRLQYKNTNSHQETTSTQLKTANQHKEYGAEIDTKYTLQCLAAKSNTAVVEINDTFSELWKEELNNTYNKIIAIANESLQQALFDEQQKWDDALSSKLECRLCYLQQIYGSGSIVPVLISEYRCQLYRERAIELNKMYEQLSSSEQAPDSLLS